MQNRLRALYSFISRGGRGENSLDNPGPSSFVPLSGRWVSSYSLAETSPPDNSGWVTAKRPDCEGWIEGPLFFATWTNDTALFNFKLTPKRLASPERKNFLR